MKQKILSLTLFFVLFSISFIFLNNTFMTAGYYVNSTKDFKELAKKTNIDVIFYGSSHTYRSFNPLIIDKECKTISFNLASAALKTSLFDLVINESFKYTKPKLLIVEAHRGTMPLISSDEDKGFQLQALDNIPLSFEKIAKIKKFYKPKEYLGALSPLLRNHSNWFNNDFSDYDKRMPVKSINTFYHGYRGSIKKVDGENRKNYKDFAKRTIIRDSLDNRFNKRVKDEFINIAQIAKNNSIELLFITSPYTTARDSYYYINEVQQFCDSLNVKYLNLNDYYDDIDLSIDDFHDLHHLNTSGSIKTSKFLSNYFNNNYSLPDRAKEPIWEILTNQYHDFINSNIEIDYSKKSDKDFSKIIKPDYLFHKTILLDKIGVFSKGENKYDILLYFNKKTDLELLKTYTLANIMYPKFPNQLLNEKDKELKRKKFAFKTNIQYINDIPVIVERNISIAPNEFELLKIYLYKKGKVLNDSILKIKNINFK